MIDPLNTAHGGVAPLFGTLASAHFGYTLVAATADGRVELAVFALEATISSCHINSRIETQLAESRLEVGALLSRVESSTTRAELDCVATTPRLATCRGKSIL